MKENKLIDLSMDFSVTVLKAVDSIKGHYALVNQIERSATSIGAIFTKQTMLKAKQILYRNYKLLSRKLMRQSIG
ncbi:MAG: hypothetical protein SO149_02665 [Candidatus Fimenecus sp.]|nr:hypothetical protein [Candidatus Fimenecus sp.]